MVKKMLGLTLIGAAMILAACDTAPAEPDYPVTRKADQVDDYFGTKVADHYRWLEDDNAEGVKAWVQAQNAVTFAELEKIPFRKKLQRRLTEIYDYPRYTSPQRVGDYYFFYNLHYGPDPLEIVIDKKVVFRGRLQLDPFAYAKPRLLRRHSWKP